MMANAKTRQGFTLVEILVAMTVGLTLLALAVPFLTEIFRTSLGVTNNLDIESSIRKLTNELADEAREANSFIIYKTFYDSGHDISGSFRNPSDDHTKADYRQRNGNHGNCCIFVFNGIDTTPNDSNPAPIERVVGYYLTTSESDEANLRKFDLSIPTSKQFDAIEEIIPPANESSIHDIVIERAQGLISGSIFYNLSEKSVMVNGRFIHNVPSKESSGTYNFTVSPRG